MFIKIIRLRFVLFFLLLLAIVVGMMNCNEPAEQKTISPYLNTNDTVQYVGMQTCRGCHQDIYNTFVETGMGKSWDVATHKKSAAVFDARSYVYDSTADMWYHPYWQGDSLYFAEYRLQGNDTIHRQVQHINYIVGSGQHTNSHLYFENGYLHQAPLTFYTQKGIWDLPPGFENGKNTRFTRKVGQECITCHNNYPVTDNTADNFYKQIKTGIECERCHGPGSVHVREKQKGNLVDIKTTIDYTIVNPAKLSRDLQISVCQRCHLQGITVLEEGKTFFDFRPGTPLSATQHSFLPRYTDSTQHFIMASHADRMKMSKCFKQSQMTCLSCHNPHVSVKATPADKFIAACQKCHKQNKCTAPMQQRMKQQDNCVTCHMPMSGSIDIPHVQIHDHFIRKPDKDKSEAIRKFVRLACVSDETPTPLVTAQAYLHYFEEYEPYPAFIDSAFSFLKKEKTSASKSRVLIHAYYLQNNYAQVITEATAFPVADINDDWTAYRIAESYLQTHQPAQAEKYLQRALDLKPNEIDYLNKLGICYLNEERWQDAEQLFKNVLRKFPAQPLALNNLGFINVKNGNIQSAEKLYLQALALQPDYESALMNLAALYNLQNKKEPCILLLKRLLQLNKNNQQAQALLQYMKQK